MAKRATKVTSAAKSLQAALKFAEPVYKTIGPAYATHVVLYGKWLYAFDGILAAGIQIDDDIEACPHAIKLSAALNKSGTNLSITKAANGEHLAIKVGGFKASVPCIPFADMPPFGPDPMIAPVDDRLKAAFADIYGVTTDNAPRWICASLALRANTVAATNAVVLFEKWHGIDLPPDLVIPKSFAVAVVRCDKKLVGFGYSEKSITFYFEDSSWYRTQRFVEQWPDTSLILDPGGSKGQAAYDIVALPAGFFDAIEAVAPFCGQTGIAHTVKDAVVAGSAVTDTPEASQACAGVPAGLYVGVAAMRAIAGRVDKVSWGASKQPMMFFGDQLRVAVARVGEPGEEEPPTGEAVAANPMPAPTVPTHPLCSLCGQPQLDTLGGVTCVNGHFNADTAVF